MTYTLLVRCRVTIFARRKSRPDTTAVYVCCTYFDSSSVAVGAQRAVPFFGSWQISQSVGASFRRLFSLVDQSHLSQERWGNPTPTIRRSYCESRKAQHAVPLRLVGCHVGTVRRAHMGCEPTKPPRLICRVCIARRIVRLGLLVPRGFRLRLFCHCRKLGFYRLRSGSPCDE